MKICKRIISLFLSFVICLSLYFVPASAAWQNEVGAWYVNSQFAPWVMGGILAYGGAAIGAGAGTVVLPGGGTIEGSVIGKTAGTALALGLYDLASYYAAGYTDEDALEEERGFVDVLENTTVSNPIYVPDGYGSYNSHVLPDINTVWTDKATYPDVLITFSTGSVVAELHFGTFGYASYSRYGPQVGFDYSTTERQTYRLYTDSTDWEYFYHYSSGQVGTSGGYWVSDNVYYSDGSLACRASAAVYPVVDSDSASRVSSLMQALNTYNIDNSYTDNSTNVNFFLCPVDVDPTLDTTISPALYDEETLVFTEPATGAQYQTTGWTYDYTTRTYDITLDAGTFSLDGTDVTRIVSTYGNELATITYYDTSGNALATDEYNYVMMSGSACSLDGHSYTYEEVKTPTCTSTGERKYTCSVCGDQYAEEVPMNAHAYTHSVLKEPTCIDSGIYVYTCSTCGNQVTESVEALDHDWQPTEVTDTTYALPEGTNCPKCSGTNYTFTRDGVIYTCTCSDCAAEWSEEADVIYGSTTYTCTRCGETKVELDEEEGSQKSWFNKLIFKFSWLTSVAKIYKQLVADITSDAATAAAVADGEVMLADVTSEHAAADGSTTYTAPELAISFGASDKYGVDWANIRPLDLSWYAPHKETVDGILSGILWLSYLFLLIKRAPGIIRGAEMVTEDRIKIDNWNIRHPK